MSITLPTPLAVQSWQTPAVLDKHLRLKPSTKPSAVQGLRPYVELRLTGHTRSYVVCEDQMVLTEAGGRYPRDIKKGDFVALPRTSFREVSDWFTEDQAVALAGLLAEGSMTENAYTFTNQDMETVRAMERSLVGYHLHFRDYDKNRPNLQWALTSDYVQGSADRESLNAELNRLFEEYNIKNFMYNFHRLKSDSRYLPSLESLQRLFQLTGDERFMSIAGKAKAKAVMREQMRYLDLHGKKAINKHIPKELFECPDETIRQFIAMFWACDGYIPPAEKSATYCELGLGGEQLIYDFQDLLSVLGVATTVRYKPVKQYHSWILRPVGRASVLKFLEIVADMPNDMKRERVAGHLARLATAAENDNLDIVPASIAGRMYLDAVRDKELPIKNVKVGMNRDSSSWKRCGASRRLLKDCAVYTGSKDLARLAEADIVWVKLDSVVSSEPRESVEIECAGSLALSANGVMLYNENACNTAFF